MVVGPVLSATVTPPRPDPDKVIWPEIVNVAEPLITRLSVLVPELAAESVAVNVTGNVPAAPGVPLSTPLELRFMPEGNPDDVQV